MRGKGAPYPEVDHGHDKAPMVLGDFPSIHSFLGIVVFAVKVGPRESVFVMGERNTKLQARLNQAVRVDVAGKGIHVVLGGQGDTIQPVTKVHQPLDYGG
jgi:hypothetical protein